MAQKLINYGQLESGKAKYDDRSSMILDGSSCVDDESATVIEDGTAAIKLISQNVAGLVDGLATYLTDVARAFKEADEELSRQNAMTPPARSAPPTVKNKGFYEMLP